MGFPPLIGMYRKSAPVQEQLSHQAVLGQAPRGIVPGRLTETDQALASEVLKLTLPPVVL